MILLEKAEMAVAKELGLEKIDNLWYWKNGVILTATETPAVEACVRLKAESLAVEEAMKEMREVVETGWEGPWFYSKAIGILRRHLEEARKVNWWL